MPDGTVFSSVEEGNRVHSTRTSDTSCMIEGDTDGVRKASVHMILGSRETLMSTMPRECWNCRVPLDSRTKLVHVIRLVPVTVVMWVQFTRVLS